MNSDEHSLYNDELNECIWTVVLFHSNFTEYVHVEFLISQFFKDTLNWIVSWSVLRIEEEEEEGSSVEEVLDEGICHKSQTRRSGNQSLPYQSLKLVRANSQGVSGICGLWWIGSRCCPLRAGQMPDKMVTEEIPEKMVDPAYIPRTILRWLMNHFQTWSLGRRLWERCWVILTLSFLI